MILVIFIVATIVIGLGVLHTHMVGVSNQTKTIESNQSLQKEKQRKCNNNS
jgi:cell division protein FtsL